MVLSDGRLKMWELKMPSGAHASRRTRPRIKGDKGRRARATRYLIRGVVVFCGGGRREESTP